MLLNVIRFMFSLILSYSQEFLVINEFLFSLEHSFFHILWGNGDRWLVGLLEQDILLSLGLVFEEADVSLLSQKLRLVVGFLALASSLGRLIEHVLRGCGIDRLLWSNNSFTHVIGVDDHRFDLWFGTSLRLSSVRPPFDQRSSAQLHTHLPFPAPQFLLNILATDLVTC